MLILNDWTRADFSRVVLSIGNFDGVHRGHRAILDAARRRAAAAGTQVVAMTFEPHPSALLTPDRVPATLTPLEYKLELLEGAGVDAAVIVQTTPAFLAIPAEQFVTDVIVKRFHPIAVVEGPTFGFGAHRRGNVRTLAAAGAQHGFEVQVVEPVRVALGGHPETIVSSSLVRHLLTSGTVDGAALCLGRPYALFGRIERGSGRGRTIGFPTANLSVGSQLIPGSGVYAGRAHLSGSGASSAAAAPIAAAISVGKNPTFDATQLTVEAFLLDFDGDLYGQLIRLEFLAWLRSQQKFDSPEALSEQIQRDVAATRQIAARP